MSATTPQYRWTPRGIFVRTIAEILFTCIATAFVLALAMIIVASYLLG